MGYRNSRDLLDGRDVLDAPRCHARRLPGDACETAADGV
jgi:hypothetical protein